LIEANALPLSQTAIDVHDYALILDPAANLSRLASREFAKPQLAEIKSSLAEFKPSRKIWLIRQKNPYLMWLNCMFALLNSFIRIVFCTINITKLAQNHR